MRPHDGAGASIAPPEVRLRVRLLTLERDGISAITWFGDTSVFPQFGLPGMLR